MRHMYIVNDHLEQTATTTTTTTTHHRKEKNRKEKKRKEREREREREREKEREKEKEEKEKRKKKKKKKKKKKLEKEQEKEKNKKYGCEFQSCLPNYRRITAFLGFPSPWILSPLGKHPHFLGKKALATPQMKSESETDYAVSGCG